MGQTQAGGVSAGWSDSSEQAEEQQQQEQQHCHLADQPVDTIGHILEFLGVGDLQNLAVTSRFFHDVVIAYIKHKTAAHQLVLSLEDFLAATGGLLTAEEQQIFAGIRREGTRLDELMAKEDLSSSDRSLLWWLMRERSRFLGRVRRISAADECVHFPHRGNEHYIPVVHDDSLDRQVCRLENVCWLQITATFPQVPPGRYTCSLVLKVLSYCRMPHADNQATYWRLSCSDTHPRTGRQWWDCLSKSQTPSAALSDGLTVHVLGGPTKPPGGHLDDQRLPAWLRMLAAGGDNSQTEELPWLRVTLPELRLTETQDVTFDLQDVECPWWKSGVVFDFIELRRIS